eukprot:scaffold1747_cov251-Pinguiococcus_pyrenoidosus.AAC.4
MVTLFRLSEPNKQGKPRAPQCDHGVDAGEPVPAAPRPVCDHHVQKLFSRSARWPHPRGMQPRDDPSGSVHRRAAGAGDCGVPRRKLPKHLAPGSRKGRQGAAIEKDMQNRFCRLILGFLAMSLGQSRLVLAVLCSDVPLSSTEPPTPPIHPDDRSSGPLMQKNTSPPIRRCGTERSRRSTAAPSS